MFLKLTDKETGTAIAVREGQIERMAAIGGGKIGTKLYSYPMLTDVGEVGDHSKPFATVKETIDIILDLIAVGETAAAGRLGSASSE
jgi:hypothetical protein